ncbi:MAG: VCBS repeat-containing protein, partial [Nocardioides sp.]
DIDGDGLGDFVTVAFDSGGWLLRSDGTSFKAPTPLPQATYPSVVGDVDGDGRLDVVTPVGYAPSLSVTVHLATGDSPSSLMQIPPVADLLTDDIPFVGDLDGDGRADVGIASTGSGRLVITAARSRADGTLARSKRWFEGDAPTDLSTYHQLLLGDLTGDGRADLVQVTEKSLRSPRLRLLASTGTSFEQQGEPQRVSGDARFVSWRAGDFDADGDDDLSMTDYGPKVTLVSWTEGRFTSDLWLNEQRDDFFPRHTSVADVDGDGDDDLVVSLSGKGLRVLDSTTNSFRVLPGGGRVVAPRKRTAGTLDPMIYSD